MLIDEAGTMKTKESYARGPIHRSTASHRVVGWYLLTPPVRADYSFNTAAPLKEWYHGGAFDTAAACEQERRQWAAEAAAMVRASPKTGEAKDLSRGLFKGALLSICVWAECESRRIDPGRARPEAPPV
jgi:hypothetical protein